MVARGFAQNTKWKNIKAAVGEVMNKAEVAYNRVQVIGEMNSSNSTHTSTNKHANDGWNNMEMTSRRKRGFGSGTT